MKPEKLRAHLLELSARRGLPFSHLRYLQWLKRKMRFEPRVIYDIGASVLHWTTAARDVWPNAEILLFDAFEPAAFLYENSRHWVGVLSNEDGRRVNFYQNDHRPAGNSYYRELWCEKGDLFPIGSHTVRVARTLDTVVREHGFPPPDLVKIDVQGAEQDVIAGGRATLCAAQRLIVEMQHCVRNDGAPTAAEMRPWIEELGWWCEAPLFSSASRVDGDYGFVRSHLIEPARHPLFLRAARTTLEGHDHRLPRSLHDRAEGTAGVPRRTD